MFLPMTPWTKISMASRLKLQSRRSHDCEGICRGRSGSRLNHTRNKPRRQGRFWRGLVAQDFKWVKKFITAQKLHKQSKTTSANDPLFFHLKMSVYSESQQMVRARFLLQERILEHTVRFPTELQFTKSSKAVALADDLILVLRIVIIRAAKNILNI